MVFQFQSRLIDLRFVVDKVRFSIVVTIPQLLYTHLLLPPIV